MAFHKEDERMSMKMSLGRPAPGILFLIPVLLFPLLFTSSLAQPPPRPPEQPVAGPGGSDYLHASVLNALYGEGATGYWLFEPQDPTPAGAPVVIFLHGWDGVNPEVYEAWIYHLVRKRRIVNYPVYQELRQTSLPEAVSNTFVGIQEAFAELARPGHVRPETDQVAVVGHSYRCSEKLEKGHSFPGLPVAGRGLIEAVFTR
jgi:acetyl esterase/lipase